MEEKSIPECARRKSLGRSPAEGTMQLEGGTRPLAAGLGALVSLAAKQLAADIWR